MSLSIERILMEIFLKDYGARDWRIEGNSNMNELTNLIYFLFEFLKELEALNFDKLNKNALDTLLKEHSKLVKSLTHDQGIIDELKAKVKCDDIESDD